MLYLAVVALALITVFADHDHEQSNPGNCREKCSKVCFYDHVKPDRLCSAFDVAEVRHVVDPWMCGEPRCQQVMCGDCGDQAHCEALCEEFKAANEIAEDAYPKNCARACRVIDEDFKCFQRCTQFPELFSKPDCESYDCSEAFCTAPGRQTCNAYGKLVDPTGMVRDTKCQDAQCSFCGNHQHCIFHCERHNRDTGDSIDCAGECQAVEGYKCWMS